MLRRLVCGLVMFLVSACVMPVTPAPSEEGSADSLPDLGAAPELVNEVWLNVDTPLRLADLRGKVVLVDMWTFG